MLLLHLLLLLRHLILQVTCSFSGHLSLHKGSDVSPGRVPDGVKESFAVSDVTKENSQGHCGDKRDVECRRWHSFQW